MIQSDRVQPVQEKDVKQIQMSASIILALMASAKMKSMATSANAIQVLQMCFECFLLAFESRDLSQADKSIKRGFSFPN